MGIVRSKLIQASILSLLAERLYVGLNADKRKEGMKKENTFDVNNFVTILRRSYLNIEKPGNEKKFSFRLQEVY